MSNVTQLRQAMTIHQRISMYPKWHSRQARYLYAFGVSNGVTKIGMTQRPQARLRQHVAVLGDSAITWIHLSAPLDKTQAKQAEWVALGIAASFGNRIRSGETFNNLSRESAIACIRAGTMSAAEEVSAETLAAACATLHRAVALLGGAGALAKTLQLCTSTVTLWLSKGVLPVARCGQIERLTHAAGAPVRCEDLRPDVSWDVLRANGSKAAA